MVLAAMLASAAMPGYGAELRLKPQCRSKAAVVTLGDIAEILTADRQQAEALAAIELFAPPVAGQRFVALREIQDRLMARGVNLAEHRFSGSTQVAVAAAEPAPVETTRPLTAAAERKGNERVSDAVTAYLHDNVAADRPWTVDVQLTADQSRFASDLSLPMSLRPVSEWTADANGTGTQRFLVTIQTPKGPADFSVDAQVTVPPLVVATLRSIPRGTLVRAIDVELRHESPAAETPGAEKPAGFSSLEAVVGKETTQTIPQGKTLQQEMLRSPLLVRRGEYVTVHARTAGIRVRTTARARDDGSLGELVTVESLLDRKAYFARVSAAQEVEVLAESLRADRTAVAGVLAE
jgi:flagella basal body P-ring formation protein FlgA